MKDWKNIKISEIASIEKCVGEFNVAELIKTPYGKFKVKIYEKQNGRYVGYTNIQLKDDDDCPFSGVGYGKTIADALEDTIRYFISMIDEKDSLKEDDFAYCDLHDF